MSQHFDQELDVTADSYPTYYERIISRLRTEMVRGEIVKISTSTDPTIQHFLNQLFTYERFCRNNNILVKEETDSAIIFYIKRLI